MAVSQLAENQMKLSRPWIAEIEYVLRRVTKQEEIPVNHLLNKINVQQIFSLSYKVNISILLSSFFFFSPVC